MRRWRCTACGRSVDDAVDPLAAAYVRNHVVGLATSHGIAGAARMLACGPEAVQGHLAEWCALREGDVPDEWPDDQGIHGVQVAGRDRILILDVDRGLLVDVVQDAAGYRCWARRRHGTSSRVWIPANAVLAGMAREVHPRARMAVPPILARRALEAAGAATFRILRHGERRNRREDVELFLRADHEISEDEREEIAGVWSIATRVLRRHHHALLAALSASGAAFVARAAEASAWLRSHAPGSRLLSLLETWTEAIAEGAGADWPDRVAREIAGLADAVRSLVPPLAGFDVLRARLVLANPDGVRVERGRGSSIPDLAEALRR